MKSCADCKWVEIDPRAGGLSTAKCNAPADILPAEPIIGRPLAERRITHCAAHRCLGPLEALFTHSCGRRGRWWEPRSKEQLAAAKAMSP